MHLTGNMIKTHFEKYSFSQSQFDIKIIKKNSSQRRPNEYYYFVPHDNQNMVKDQFVREDHLIPENILPSHL